MPHEEDQLDEPSNILIGDENSLSDDQINESLFNRYDQMFNIYNQFGSRFQETAHYIGLLIKKNMNLNQKVEDLEDESHQLKEQLKQQETSYENLLQSLTEKDKVIEDLLGENTSFKLQIEQLMAPRRQGQAQQSILQFGQRDILKEREEARKQQEQDQQKQNSIKLSNNKKDQVQLQIPNKQLNQKQINSNSKPQLKLEQQLQRFGGTYESFFEIEQNPIDKQQSIDDSSSLRDLFSMRNTKKRSSPSKDPNENSIIEDQWITNKRKQRKSYEEESQIADKFQKLSQAFFNPNPKINPNAFDSAMNNNIGSVMQSRKRDSIGASSVYQFVEDSGSTSSLINAGIKFDAKQAQESLKQVQQNYNNNQKAKHEKKFDIKVIEQVSDSFVEDFFTVKHEKKQNLRSNASNTTTSANSNKQNQKSGAKKK
ncbi:UNKNOWN [Stylonychia lemnae]|uniref:Uncharacterized protein n=1 Tax=Stylonychia lemnae TaxID=5949 RepID=A0A077ZMS7_STYLE|nr:UNKNOWN [Stylonychia lemnae]|eukprot:CDW71272.1 UNKNOWN [Stylonychia lemnae]